MRGPSNRKRPYGLRQPPPPGPSTRTGNVQLYLSESRRTPIWMSGPLGGFGGGVKEVRTKTLLATCALANTSPERSRTMPDMEEQFADEGPDIDSAEPRRAMTKTDRAIEKEFSEGRLRVIQEKNDLFLPHVVDFIKVRKWGNLRPEYQRRLRWSSDKKSKLIESFIMNVPVPPIFLYEASISRYEVMDGQQRLNAIVEFLENEFALSGLEI